MAEWRSRVVARQERLLHYADLEGILANAGSEDPKAEIRRFYASEKTEFVRGMVPYVYQPLWSSKEKLEGDPPAQVNYPGENESEDVEVVPNVYLNDNNEPVIDQEDDNDDYNEDNESFISEAINDYIAPGDEQILIG